MAKAKTTKAKAETPKKTSAPKKTVAAKSSALPTLETVSTHVHSVLEKLQVAPALRNDIEWCLGSYRHDHNPAGLLEKLNEAKKILETLKKEKPKAVTAKLISDLQKVTK
ncbi:MAG: hypothetical protein O9302_09160 [Cyclobacteriaceae bacterium]|jgi:hypothetical protein|nr:hypothetical protein [Flammeovirgaceae bacterium]MCZ8022885.1 hypothetical protein [Cytophagales bacterium]MCZ8328214.1 hypothetical protein [Cyclobacteriaceae bacterium]